MGAYYKAVNLEDMECFSPYEFDNGAKMLEHGYISNNYVDVALNEIFAGSWKNKPIAWVCDYDTSAKYDGVYTKAVSISSCAENVDWLDFSDAIIVNNDKQEYIDLTEFKLNYPGERNLMIHPFCLLTSSTDEGMGGGDYHNEHPLRSTWAGDKFVITFNRADVPFDYKNVSKDVYFFEEDNLERIDEFKIKALRIDKKPDLETRERVLKDLDYDASLSEAINFLKLSEKAKLTFKKTNGDIVSRIATLDADYESDEGYTHNDRYLWFYDLEADTLKKMVFENFISLKKA